MQIPIYLRLSIFITILNLIFLDLILYFLLDLFFFKDEQSFPNSIKSTLIMSYMVLMLIIIICGIILNILLFIGKIEFYKLTKQSLLIIIILVNMYLLLWIFYDVIIQLILQLIYFNIILIFPYLQLFLMVKDQSYYNFINKE